jgi:hypothetical protein
VGMYGTFGAVIDTIGFYYDNCYCIRSRILPYLPPNLVVKLGFSYTADVTWIGSTSADTYWTTPASKIWGAGV